MIPSAVPLRIPLAKKVVAADPALCRGCDACRLACSLRHEGQCGFELSRIEVSKDFVTAEFVPNVCRQCQGPECMFACPVKDAMYVDSATGARVVDEARCIGCGLCVKACQFNAIKLDRHKKVAFNCDLCGGAPECVEVCPTGALSYPDWKQWSFRHDRGLVSPGSPAKNPRTAHVC